MRLAVASPDLHIAILDFEAKMFYEETRAILSTAHECGASTHNDQIGKTR